MDKKHYGSTLDLAVRGNGRPAGDERARLSKRIFVEQLREAMKRRRISPLGVREADEHEPHGRALDSLTTPSRA